MSAKSDLEKGYQATVNASKLLREEVRDLLLLFVSAEDTDAVVRAADILQGIESIQISISAIKGDARANFGEEFDWFARNTMMQDN